MQFQIILFVSFSIFVHHHIFLRVFKANGNKAPLTYVKFQSVVAKFGTPAKALDAPGNLPKQCQTLLLSEDYNVPLLEEMRVDLTGLGKELFPGGESEALIRLNKYMNQQVF